MTNINLNDILAKKLYLQNMKKKKYKKKIKTTKTGENQEKTLCWTLILQ